MRGSTNMVIQLNKFRLKLAAFLIVVNPILLYYDLPGSNVSVQTVNLIVTLFCLIRIRGNQLLIIEKSTFKLFKPMFLLVLYNFILSAVIPSVYFSEIAQPIVHIILIGEFLKLVLVCQISANDERFVRYIIKYYLVLCGILIFIVFLLEGIFIFEEKLVPVRIGFLPLNSEYEALAYRFGYNWRGNFVGFSPFFSEPSHMAQYFIPAFCILLSDVISRNKKRVLNIIFLLLMECSIILSTSSYGVATSAIIAIVFICLSDKKAAKNSKFILCIMIIFCFVISVVNERVHSEWNTLLSGLSYGNDKSTYRLYRGIVYYLQFPTLFQVFGIGFSQFSNFIKLKNITFIYENYSMGTVVEYLNGFSQAIIYNGMLGFILLIIFLRKLYKKGNSESKALTVGLVLLYATTATYLRGNSIFYIIIILILKNGYLRRDEAKRCCVIGESYGE